LAAHCTRITHIECCLNSSDKHSVPSSYSALQQPHQVIRNVQHLQAGNNIQIKWTNVFQKQFNHECRSHLHKTASQGWGFPGWALQSACLHALNASSIFQHSGARMSLLVCPVSCVENSPHSDRNISQLVSYTFSSCSTIQNPRITKTLIAKEASSYSARKSGV
jgi:hypothetical protein